MSRTAFALRRRLLGAILSAAATCLGAAATADEHPPAGPASAGDRMEIVAGVPKGGSPDYSVGRDGMPAGFAVDVLNEVARRAGMNVTYRIFDSRAETRQALADGRIDLIPGLGITGTRRTEFAFSTAYQSSRVGLFKRASDPPVGTLRELRERPVGAVAAGVAETLLRDRAAVVPQSFSELDDALDALLVGRTDILAGPESAIRHLARQRGKADAIDRTGPALADVMRGFAVGAHRQALLAALDPHLRAFSRSAAFETSYRRWYGIGNAEPVSPWYWILPAAVALAALALVLWWRRRAEAKSSPDTEYARLEKRLWNRALVSATVIVVLTVGVANAALFYLYTVAFEETRSILFDRANAKSALVEAVASFDRGALGDAARGRAATLSQLREGFGRLAGSVETNLAEQRDENVRFVLRQMAPDKFAPLDIPFGSDLAQAMQRALSGESGTLVARDYRGVTVLAAYRPLPLLGLGYVIQKDVAAIAAPFVRGGLAATAGAIVLALLGVFGYLGLTVPLMRQALRSDSLFRALSRATGSGMMILQPVGGERDFVIQSVNPAGAKIERSSPERLVGRRVAEHFWNDAETGLLDAVSRVFASGATEFLPPRQYETAAGTTWRFCQIYRLSPGDVVFVYEDVTERENTLGALRESEERFRQIAENIGEVFWITDVEKKAVLYVSPAYEQIWGRPVQGLYDDPRAFIEAIHPDDRDRVERSIARQPFAPHFEEFRIVRPDGSMRWVRVRSFPVRDETGAVYRLAGLSADVTEEKEREARLRESEERFRQIAENIREMVWLMDPVNNVMIYASPAYEEVWGRSLESLYDEPWSFLEAVHPDDLPAILENIEKPRLEPFQREYRIIRPDGAVRWVRARGVPVTDESGAVYRMVGVSEDVTEEKERQTQLRQAQKLEALGQMTGGIAHDFNNLLLIIQGNICLLQDRLSGDPEAAELAHSIDHAAQRAGGLTDRMLTFARKKPLVLTPVEVNSCVARLHPLLASSAGETFTIDMRLLDEPVAVRIDEACFEACLINLVVNARDAMPDGGRLTVETRIIDITASQIPGAGGPAPGRYVEIAVSDTGCGIPHDVLSRVFDPFFTTKEPGKGTGLGLAMVYGFIQEAGGHTAIDSKVGKGTVVRICLPCVDALDDAAEPAAPGDLQGGAQEASSKNAATSPQRTGVELSSAANG